MTQPIWIGCGAALRRVLAHARWARAFNLLMAAALLAATLPLVIAKL